MANGWNGLVCGAYASRKRCGVLFHAVQLYSSLFHFPSRIQG